MARPVVEMFDLNIYSGSPCENKHIWYLQTSFSTSLHFYIMNLVKMNWVYGPNSDFLIPISWQTYGLNLWYFKLRLFNLTCILGLQRYGDEKIRVFGKNLIPFYLLQNEYCNEKFSIKLISCLGTGWGKKRFSKCNLQNGQSGRFSKTDFTLGHCTP